MVESVSLEESRMVEENTPLVTSLAARFLYSGQEFEDLCQVGMLGLLRAVRNFDRSRGLCFSTYAVPVILGEIRRYLRDEGSVKVSRTLKENYIRIRRAEQTLSRRLDASPTLSEICAETGLTREEVLRAMEGASKPVSLEAPVGEEGNLSLGDTVPLTESIDAVDRLALKEGISSLPPLERQIVTLRYFYARTQQQTADALGLTQVQVSRKEKKILQTLRRGFNVDE
ncbi:MAG: sigma-70 family RNA polymerase sigma factor [Clostridia bacterium]|nr:sigma-70 family RNA polymerase sigma factor [Clostridia bacterium]